MEDRKVIYNIQHDMWRLVEKYGYQKLDDKQWEQFVNDGQRLLDKYKPCGKALEALYRDMFRAVQTYYVRKQGNNNGG